ncbi:MAG: PAS domain-containing protein [Pseudorhodobacter sp.]
MASIMDETGTDYHIAENANEPLAQVRAYWEALRDRDGGLPMRSQISPRGIEAALSSTFLIERIAPGMARFRIAGMDLADIMGMEVRGMPISTMISSSARADFASKLERVFHSPAILTLNLQADTGIGRPTLTACMQILPIRNLDGQPNLALGSISLKGAFGRTPRRFGISSATVVELNRPSADKTEATPKRFVPTLFANAQPLAFAEAGENYEPPRKGKGISYLRLVK